MQQTLTKLTDLELVKAYADGDNAAFDTLLSRHQRTVFTYILRTVKDSDLANDIFQETFIKAITTIRQGRYEETGKFGGWLIRVARNIIIDQYRRSKSENTVSNDSTEQDLFNNRDLCDGNIEDAIVMDELNHDLHSMLMALPESQREVLLMRIYSDMSFKEIASETGVSINTALGRMRYALINMRRLANETRLLEVV